MTIFNLDGKKLGIYGGGALAAVAATATFLHVRGLPVGTSPEELNNVLASRHSLIRDSELAAKLTSNLAREAATKAISNDLESMPAQFRQTQFKVTSWKSVGEIYTAGADLDQPGDHDPIRSEINEALSRVGATYGSGERDSNGNIGWSVSSGEVAKGFSMTTADGKQILVLIDSRSSFADEASSLAKTLAKPDSIRTGCNVTLNYRVGGADAAMWIGDVNTRFTGEVKYRFDGLLKDPDTLSNVTALLVEGGEVLIDYKEVIVKHRTASGVGEFEKAKKAVSAATAEE